MAPVLAPFPLAGAGVAVCGGGEGCLSGGLSRPAHLTDQPLRRRQRFIKF